jgi:hypothetical protein
MTGPMESLKILGIIEEVSGIFVGWSEDIRNFHSKINQLTQLLTVQIKYINSFDIISHKRSICYYL